MAFRCLIDAVACTIGPVILFAMTTALVLTMFSTAPPSQGGSAFGGLLAVGSYAVLVSIPLKVARREADPCTLSRWLSLVALLGSFAAGVSCSSLLGWSCGLCASILSLLYYLAAPLARAAQVRLATAFALWSGALLLLAGVDHVLSGAAHLGPAGIVIGGTVALGTSAVVTWVWFAAMRAAHDCEGVCRRSGGFELVTRWR